MQLLGKYEMRDLIVNEVAALDPARLEFEMRVSAHLGWLAGWWQLGDSCCQFAAHGRLGNVTNVNIPFAIFRRTPAGRAAVGGRRERLH